MSKEQFWERSLAEYNLDEVAQLSTGEGAQQALWNADEIHLKTLFEQCIAARIYDQMFGRSRN